MLMAAALATLGRAAVVAALTGTGLDTGAGAGGGAEVRAGGSASAILTGAALLGC